MGGGALAVARVTGTSSAAVCKLAATRSVHLDAPSCSPALLWGTARGSHTSRRHLQGALCRDLRSSAFLAGELHGGLSGGVPRQPQSGRAGLRIAAALDTSDVVKAAEGSKSAALVMIRHGESLWNAKNLFTGCVDVPLSQKGIDEALEAGARIADIPVDIIFVSALMRAQMTAMIAMTQHRRKKVPVILHEESERAKAWSTIFSQATMKEVIPVKAAWQLNERMYGELQGLNKAETADKFGADTVKQWRRSFDIPPPNGESLQMTAERAVAYFKAEVEPLLKAGKNVLISAHGNSLRAIIMYLDSLTSEQVIELELATGNPMLYVYEEGAFKRRGSPVGPAVDGVYALTPDLATYRNKLESKK